MKKFILIAIISLSLPVSAYAVVFGTSKGGGTACSSSGGGQFNCTGSSSTHSSNDARRAPPSVRPRAEDPHVIDARGEGYFDPRVDGGIQTRDGMHDVRSVVVNASGGAHYETSSRRSGTVCPAVVIHGRISYYDCRSSALNRFRR